MAEKKLQKAAKPTTNTKNQKTAKPAQACRCPFCDEEMKSLKLPVCDSCGVAIVFCDVCRKPLPKGARTCPDCGKKTAKK